MDPPRIAVPDAFARSTIEREGDAGRRWIDDLPRTVANYMRAWGLVRDGAVLHGYVGIVVPVRQADRRCVLKVSWRDASSADEHVALRAWNGSGAVLLLDADPHAGALLLERLGPALLVREPIERAARVAAGLLRRLAIPFDGPVRTLDLEADTMRQELSAHAHRFAAVLPPPLVADTMARIDDLTPTAERRLVDHDLHYENILEGTREPWLAIDPKVLIGDPGYALAPLLWNRFDEVRAHGIRRLFDLLVETAGLDPARARAWTRIHLVEFWLWSLRMGQTADPARCAVLVEALSGA